MPSPTANRLSPDTASSCGIRNSAITLAYVLV